MCNIKWKGINLNPSGMCVIIFRRFTFHNSRDQKSKLRVTSLLYSLFNMTLSILISLNHGRKNSRKTFSGKQIKKTAGRATGEGQTQMLSSHVYTLSLILVACFLSAEERRDALTIDAEVGVSFKLSL